jgi:hypothetical protein
MVFYSWNYSRQSYALLFCLTVFSLAPLAVVDAPLYSFLEGGDCFIFLLNGLYFMVSEQGTSSTSHLAR